MWNYRVIQHKNYVGLHECYYKKGRKKPYMWAEEPEVVGDDLEDLVARLHSMYCDAKRHNPGHPFSGLKILKVENMPGMATQKVEGDNE